jgi:hypothetical protein
MLQLWWSSQWPVETQVIEWLGMPRIADLASLLSIALALSPEDS